MYYTKPRGNSASEQGEGVGWGEGERERAERRGQREVFNTGQKRPSLLGLIRGGRLWGRDCLLVASGASEPAWPC